jgi:two-component sensor histidine kinase/DNA-binding LacI/PurR family transcriptional regulator
VSNSSRPVVGLLTPSIVEPWAIRQWEGVVEAARDLDVELVCYIGGVLRSPHYDEEANVMYDLAASAHLDGLIFWSTALGWLIPRPDMSAFLARFGALPIVSMEMSFPGMHSVLMDDYGGMRAVIDHFIEGHGRRRIAFLRGPSTHEGFEARYQAYLDSLEAHGLPLDPALVVQSSSDIVDGADAASSLLGPGRPSFDALSGANDNLVISALPVLARHGLRVPEDVAVAGFDNLPEALTTSPPLTSADPPFREMGRRAVETLVDMLEGRSVPESVVMPIGFARRLSCGCPDPASTMQFNADGCEPEDGPDCTDKGWAFVAAAAQESVPKTDKTILRDLWSRFVAEIHGAESGSFLSILDCELEKAEANGTDATDLLRLLTAIQRATFQWTAALPYELRLKAGELWGRAQEVVASAIKRQIARRQVSFATRHSILRILNEKLGSTYDLEAQMDIMSKDLVRLGIPGCYIALYTRPDEPTGEACLILAFDGERRLAIPAGGLPFPAPDLVPRSVDGITECERERRGLSRLALALYYGREKIGFVVFDINGKEDASLCEILRWQLSGALKYATDIRVANAVAEEKAALLKELQHRVKNSISLIASLSRIESAGASHPETKDALESLEARITAVGDLYEVLYDSGGIESVDLSDYLARVVDSVTASVGGGSGRIEFDRSFEHCPMDLKRAVSLGLIVNELITDSLKHAFPEGRTGRVSVTLAREGASLVLEVGDDGIGYPPDFCPNAAEGFGLKMVSLLTKQLEGSLSFETGGIGTRARLCIHC